MKKKILIIGPYLPGKSFGGPVKSLVNITETLSKKYSFFVLTADRDLHSNSSYENIIVGDWNTVGKAKVFYLPLKKDFKKIYEIIKSNGFDLIYLNSFFSKHSIFIQFLAKIGMIRNPILLAPRGEFSPGALNIKSFKKKIFLFVYKLLKMHKGIIFTSNLDKDKSFIKEMLGKNISVMKANNIVTNQSISDFKKPYKQKGEVKIATVSRIAQIKNLHYSLELLKSIEESNADFKKITFDVYGPIEDIVYWNMCLSIIESMGDKITVNYMGALEYGEVIKTLSTYHIFLLPTKGENFGHVIQEALLAACPLVISDQTPWIKLEDSGVGYDISLEKVSDFKSAINEIIAMNQEKYVLMSNMAYEYGVQKIKSQDSIEAHIKIFEKTMELKRGIRNV